MGGCALDPSAVPMPGTSVQGETYPLRVEFANTLNLPARAKVTYGGIQIGTLRQLTLIDPSDSREGYVVADLEISESVMLPVTTSAQLRQATILGDIYIALVAPPHDATDLLAPGGTIPVEQSVPAVQIEDVMAGISTFVGGGAFKHGQDIVFKTNAVLPADPAHTAVVSDVLGANLIDLSTSLEAVDAFLDGTTATTGAVLENDAALKALLTEEGATQAVRSMESLVATLGLFGSLGMVAHSLEWLTPFFASADGAAKAFMPLAFTARPLDLTAPSNLNMLVDLLRNKIIPFVEFGPTVNVVDVTIESNSTDLSRMPVDAQVDRIVETLRMIGVVR
ncbi:Putative Mce family protein [Hoyosella subflava DQS3-9A1]|uniref:Putative Mce family protein n=2 Tax=Hoyosella TaxID=697025 RepID=F6ERN9_HOYSD|nr:Putative Mce family protein [Hoyosella subflava DQS3-9A1]